VPDHSTNSKGQEESNPPEQMVGREPPSARVASLHRRWKIVLVALGTAALVGVAGFGVYSYRASHEFVVTGEILYKVGTYVHAAAGADLEVYKLPLDADFYRTLDLIRERQSTLNFYRPGSGLTLDAPSRREHDSKYASLQVSPLANMDGTWWESDRLQNCSLGRGKLSRSSQYVGATSTDMGGHFWLKLKRGQYEILASSEVETSADFGGGPKATTATALWDISIIVRGDMKIVSANAFCSPD